MPVRRAARPAPDASFRSPPRGRNREEDIEPSTNVADDEDERPARGRATRRSADEAPARGRRALQPVEEDEDEGGEDEAREPARRARSGWGGAKEAQAEASTWPDRFKVEYKTSYVIAFLEDEPFASYNMHWLDDAPGKRKSFYCLGKAECPLCNDLGDKSNTRSCFDVIVFVEESKDNWVPVLKVWEASSSILQQLQDIHEDPKRGPLTDGYWLVSKSKSGTSSQGATTYSISKIKERDLEADYEISPLTDKEFDEFMEQKHDASTVTFDRKSELRDLVTTILGRG